MSKTVEYFFDVASPATYLSWTQLPKLAEETGATIVYKPMLLGGLFKATGNSSPITVPAKGRWLFKDLNLWAKRYGVTFKMNSKFPINTLYIMRGLVAYLNDDRFVSLGDAFFDAMWVNDKDLNQPEVMAEIISAIGIDPAEYIEKIGSDEVKGQLMTITKEAEDRGAFGAPTFFVGDTMFWGQDRIDFVYDAVVG